MVAVGGGFLGDHPARSRGPVLGGDGATHWALGLFELFVADLHLPEWLTVHNLGDLKRPIIQVLVVVIVIKFVERMLMTGALDTLYYGAATAVVTHLPCVVHSLRRAAGLTSRRTCVRRTSCLRPTSRRSRACGLGAELAA
ncbi:YqhA family protein [Mycobacterium simiae]|uniref:YqhA family protein n=1 Tax=Mycobacterium simiae TaxID=1784 RepID=A0A5B1BS62_MYCSI|nr:YqhA family protein [Mycobacterium simiae]